MQEKPHSSKQRICAPLLFKVLDVWPWSPTLSQSHNIHPQRTVAQPTILSPRPRGLHPRSLQTLKLPAKASQSCHWKHLNNHQWAKPVWALLTPDKHHELVNFSKTNSNVHLEQLLSTQRGGGEGRGNAAELLVVYLRQTKQTQGIKLWIVLQNSINISDKRQFLDNIYFKIFDFSRLKFLGRF